MTTNIFYDCEFLEDGQTIDLISIGMVSSDGREYYAVSGEFNTHRVATDPWLMANVMSSIDHEVIGADEAGVGFELNLTDPAVKARRTIAKDIRGFIAASYQPQLWAWYGAYDHVCYAQLFGKMIHLPDGMPMYTNDIKTLQVLTHGRGWPTQPEGVHNALADAKHNKVKFDYLWGLLSQ